MGAGYREEQGSFEGELAGGWLAAGLLILFYRAVGMDAGGDLVWIRKQGEDVGLLMGQAAAAHPASLLFSFFTPTLIAEKCFIHGNLCNSKKTFSPFKCRLILCKPIKW
jgi:uncharacterized membrane protein